MPILEADLRSRLEAPKKQHTKALQRAARHENRLRFHGQADLSEYDSGWAATEFLQGVKERLPADKYANFINLMRWPLPTVSLMDKVYKALEKVFDGRDPVYQAEFTDESLAEDWEEYRNMNLRPSFWKTEGFEAMRTDINSVLVVDLPAEQDTERPQPYFYLLQVESVLEYEQDAEGKLQWLAFVRQVDEDTKQIVVLDDSSYRLFSTEDGKHIENLIREAPHDLGYCPARWFWTTPITHKQKELKKAPATAELDNLDWLLYYIVSKRNLDNYGAWAIYWGFTQDCDYVDPRSGNYCDSGHLKSPDNIYIINRNHGTIRECPVCSTKRLTGAGSFIEVPPPGPHNDGADLRPPVGVIPVNRESLDFNVEEVERQKDAIFRNITGDGGEPVNNQAVNEKQVSGFFESKKEKIRSLAKNFELAQKWAEETVARLMFGNAFLGISLSYGTEFYLHTADEILQEYMKAKGQGADDIILDIMQDQYYETKYRNNPEALQRVKILLNLEPFRHLTKQQVREMYGAGQVSFSEFMVKQNFSSLILRFERENASIMEFGNNLQFDAKIEAIRTTLLQYATEQQQNTGNGTGEAATTGQPGESQQGL